MLMINKLADFFLGLVFVRERSSVLGPVGKQQQWQL